MDAPLARLRRAGASLILTKNYPTNERSLKAKFTVYALCLVHFSLSFRLGTKTTETCNHFVVLLMCTADQQNTVSRPEKRISAVPEREILRFHNDRALKQKRDEG